VLGFGVEEPSHLEPYNPWYAGFFDADGSVVLRESPKAFPQLSIRVGQKRRPDLEIFRALGGNIYYDAGSGGSFVWSISDRLSVETFWQRLRPHLRSTRSRRLFLLPRYRQLLGLKAHLPGSVYTPEWLAFRRHWLALLESSGEQPSMAAAPDHRPVGAHQKKAGVEGVKETEGAERKKRDA
jgi:hypothetical protein